MTYPRPRNNHSAVRVSASLQGFGPISRGIEGVMELSLLLIVIGIILAVLVNYALGIVCILIGLVLLVWPRLRAGRADRV
jgi:hypothetical protein